MNKFYYLSPLILQTLIWIPTRIILKSIYCYRIEGLKNLEGLKYKNKKHSKPGVGRAGVIFAVNHSSELDPIMIPASLPFLSGLMPMFYVSREQKFYKNSGWRQVFYGGFIFRLWGAYNAYAGLKDYEASLKDHIKILEDGRSVCIFPEGHKTKDGNIGEGKSGVSFLLNKTNSAVVPVRIRGLFKPQKEKDFMGRRKITISFGNPIYKKDVFNTENPNIKELKKTTEVIMDKIKEL